MMRAAFLEELHQPLVIKTVDRPVPALGEVIVKLHAAALNHRDIWIQKGLYPGAKAPMILGSDGSGVVIDSGDAVTSEWIGKEVIINPVHNWGNHADYYGPNFKILGLPDAGTFAQYVKVNAAYLAPKPKHLSFEEAAALPMGILTAWRALVTKAQLSTNKKVFITGIGGGVALFALQIAVLHGAEVWVSSSDDNKIERAIQLGATGGINYKKENWHKELLQQTNAPRHGYFDCIIDGAGGDDYLKLIDIASPGGRIVSYGGTTGIINGLIPAKVFFKQLQLLGSMVGNEQEFADAIQFVEKQALQPIIAQTFPLENINTAFQYMQEGKQFGKIIISI